MLFNSWQFIFLVVVTFALYYSIRTAKYQQLVLILASFIFYGAFKPILLLLLWLSVSVNILASWLLRDTFSARKFIICATGVTFNLAVLAFFKYAGLLSLTFLPHESSVSTFLLTIPLPIGISFFTFQGISLLVDTYRQRDEINKTSLDTEFSKHAVEITLFISFFPQLVAGPIVKARDFLPQISLKRINEIEWISTGKILLSGYFLKMVVADNLKDFTVWIEYPYFLTKSTLSLTVMLLGYSAQIFADFAGYSLIAIGVAKLFGYRLRENFNFPYISSSFSEFWNRWHISLSSFLKEYLYFPLGGNKRGNNRTYFNLLTVMVLGGLWHGAAWSYAVWGFAHGLALAAERFISSFYTLPKHPFLTALKVSFVFTYVTFAWLLFQLPNFNEVVLFIGALKDNLSLAEEPRLIISLLTYTLPIMLYHLYYLHKRDNPGTSVAILEPYMYGIMLFLIVFNSGSAASFVYFQF